MPSNGYEYEHKRIEVIVEQAMEVTCLYSFNNTNLHGNYVLLTRQHLPPSEPARAEGFVAAESASCLKSQYQSYSHLKQTTYIE
jgi:hypothetical protein